MITTDYDNFAKTFAKSRKNMKWAELEYFFSQIEQGSLLDIWCGSGRLIDQYKEYFSEDIADYFGLDMSSWLINEAQKSFPQHDFWVWNMLEISSVIWDKKYENIFLIASFHHLETLKERESMMKVIYELCETWAKVFMTNWALESPEHLEKYKNAKIVWSENEFGSSDFSIKIWEFDRFYHNFDLWELEYLSKNAWFNIIENKLFQTQKNFITILQK